jgi:hypothetical protein
MHPSDRPLNPGPNPDRQFRRELKIQKTLPARSHCPIVFPKSTPNPNPNPKINSPLMAPRKRTTSSRRTSQSNHPSEPAKFGIQHFFERHLSQTSSFTQNPKPNSTSLSQSNPKSKSEPSSSDPVPPPAALEADDSLSEISPEASKTKRGPLKRLKFSPGMVSLSLPLKRFLVHLF